MLGGDGVVGLADPVVTVAGDGGGAGVVVGGVARTVYGGAVEDGCGVEGGEGGSSDGSGFKAELAEEVGGVGLEGGGGLGGRGRRVDDELLLFVVEEIEELVFDDGTAEADTVLLIA